MLSLTLLSCSNFEKHNCYYVTYKTQGLHTTRKSRYISVQNIFYVKDNKGIEKDINVDIRTYETINVGD